MKAIFLAIFILLLTPTILAWDSCEGDCEYPGDCGQYIDSNNNDLCDHGELEAITQDPIQKSSKMPYDLIFLSVILILAYIISHILSKEKIIKVVTHKRIWNVLLLLSFLVVGITGILLVIRINYGFTANPPFNIMYWHVEVGIVMTLISIFHIIWHYPYFKAILKG